jgi:hypothetical protein
MMQAAQEWHRSRDRRIFIEREVGPHIIIIRSVCPKDAPQVRLAENHRVVEALSSNGTD